VTGFEKKTAVVTGGARGIGHAYAGRLADDGANVVVIDVNDASDSLVGLGGTGVKRAIVCDLGSAEQIADAVRAVLDEFGRCDILVNNAGIFPTGDLDVVRLETWRRVQAVNVEAMLLLAQGFAPGMKAAGWGRIVNTGSGNTLTQVRDLAYMTSKGSVHALTRALANNLGEYGITVNAIAPSVVATEGFLGRDRADGPSADEIFARMSALQTIKRPSEPVDLANMLGFLVSDQADFITGQILHVDGGATRTGA
jgi:NAD(P)-dependent dehydrogenase (short-subunit alcohol dehydrogenase family)